MTNSQGGWVSAGEPVAWFDHGLFAEVDRTAEQVNVIGVGHSCFSHPASATASLSLADAGEGRRKNEM